jgi:deoxyribonuclease-4
MAEKGRKRIARKSSRLLFGTGGVPLSVKSRATIDGVRRIKELGLDAMEIEFVRGVKMGGATAREVAAAAAETGVALSAHGPYYINLNARTPDKVKGSQEMVLQTARIGALCGARSIVFHSAFTMGDTPAKTYRAVKRALGEVIAILKAEGNPVWVRPEVMGRASEFGPLAEVLRLSKELDGQVLPGVDFAHMHAYEKVSTYDDFLGVLRNMEDALGRVALDNLHIHFSGIKYGAKGEIAHLNLRESDLKWQDLLQALHDVDAKGVVICECPNLEEDALLLKETYLTLR